MDRGVLRPGYLADINVIDFDRLNLRAPYMAYDLPMGAGRLMQDAEGYVAIIKAGEIIYRNGQTTGALPGKLVRALKLPSYPVFPRPTAFDVRQDRILPLPARSFRFGGRAASA